jgi:AcrR family transcriptional regulator
VFEAPGRSAPSAIGGRRERKKLETRAALEAAALRLFAERGYEQTTVEDIADAADVAVRTFFRYFASKQHVLFGDVAISFVSRLREALAERPADEPPVAAVAAAIETLTIVNDEEHHEIMARMRLVRELPELMPAYLTVLHQMQETIAAFVARRTGEPDTAPYPQLVAGAAALAAKASLAEVGRSDLGPREHSELRRRAYRALTAGLDAFAPDPAGARRG